MLALPSLALGASSRTKEKPRPLACSPQALKAALAAGGRWQFTGDCFFFTGDVLPLEVTRTVSLSSGGHQVELSGYHYWAGDYFTPKGGITQRIFDVRAGHLTLNSIVISGVSGHGPDHAPASSTPTGGTAGADGAPGAAGALGGGAGGDGGPGGAGKGPPGGSTAPGEDSTGGCIRVESGAALTLIGGKVIHCKAIAAAGSDGNWGGKGGNGGSGGVGGAKDDGSGHGTGGAGGNGAPGGTGGGPGGAGSPGGNAFGGAIYNRGTLTVISTTFYNDCATGGQGGAGGVGGAGGAGGSGGEGGQGGNTGGKGEIGATGASGASGGPGGRGGDAEGGAIYNDGGRLRMADALIDGATVWGAHGGAGGWGGQGGLGGGGGDGGPGGSQVGPGGNGANGGNGGNGGDTGAGGDAIDAAISSTVPITSDTAIVNSTALAGNDPTHRFYGNGCTFLPRDLPDLGPGGSGGGGGRAGQGQGNGAAGAAGMSGQPGHRGHRGHTTRYCALSSRAVDRGGHDIPLAQAAQRSGGARMLRDGKPIRRKNVTVVVGQPIRLSVSCDGGNARWNVEGTTDKDGNLLRLADTSAVAKYQVEGRGASSRTAVELLRPPGIPRPFYLIRPGRFRVSVATVHQGGDSHVFVVKSPVAERPHITTCPVNLTNEAATGRGLPDPRARYAGPGLNRECPPGVLGAFLPLGEGHPGIEWRFPVRAATSKQAGVDESGILAMIQILSFHEPGALPARCERVRGVADGSAFYDEIDHRERAFVHLSEGDTSTWHDRDSPHLGLGLKSGGPWYRSWNAHDYLMYLSDIPGSVWVNLGSMHWSWFVRVTQDPATGLWSLGRRGRRNPGDAGRTFTTHVEPPQFQATTPACD